MRARTILLGLSLVACSKLTKSNSDASAPAADASAATDASAAVATPAGGRAIAGVGDVPPWSPDKGGPKCTPSADARAKLKPLERGDDAAVSAGTSDLAALQKSVGADACFATRKVLATALNDGGFHHYQGKKYDAANHYWQAALTVRPSTIIARYNLTCGLALTGKGPDAIAELQEIARAAAEGDASAANFLEKAKSDDDLKALRSDPAFKKAVESSTGALVGPRKEPETSAKATPLLPADFRKVKDELGVQPSGFWTYKPAVTNVWTWRPDGKNEMLVTTIIDDPAKAGKPKGDMNQDYGAIAVFKRDGEKLTLLLARKTGESPPSVASGKANAVAYSYDAPCGTLKGTLTWTGKVVEVHEKSCSDL